MFKNTVLKPSVDTAKWFKKAAIRAVKTMAQTAGGMVTAGALISEINWSMVASASVVAGVYSLLMSIAGIPEVEEE